MRKAFPILGVLTAIFLSYALYLALVVAPREQTMIHNGGSEVKSPVCRELSSPAVRESLRTAEC